MKQNRGVQYFAAFGASLAMMTTAVVYFWTAPVLPKFLNHETGINLTSHELSWIVALTAPGSVAGSLISSVMADKLGRRGTLLASALPFIIGTVLVLCATNALWFYIARILWGFGIGMSSSVISVYVSEIADKDIRGRLTTGTRIMFNFGVTLVLIVGSFVSYQTLSYVVVGCTVCYFSVCWWIPETPYYLLKEGKVDAARKELLKLSGLKNGKEIEEKLALMGSDVKREMTQPASVKELFTSKRYRKAIIISTGLRITQIMSGSLPIQQYFGMIILDSNGSVDVSTAMILFGILRFAIVFLSSVIVDKVGRRPLLISTYIGASVTLASIGLYFFLQDIIDLSDYRYFVLTGIIIYKIFANLGFDILIFVVPAEIFPLNVKAKAITALSIYGSFLMFGVMRGFQIMKDLTGLHGVFWFHAASAAIGAIFTYFVVPETKGKSLREIQMELQGDMFGEDSGKLSQVVAAEAGGMDGEVDEGTELTSMRSAGKVTLK